MRNLVWIWLGLAGLCAGALDASSDWRTFTDLKGRTVEAKVLMVLDDEARVTLKKNNRDARGHRRWCLNPPMEKAAFGGAGKYSAMWCMDSGGKRLKDSWAYPGKGLFPKEYVHGNAWSLYLPGGSPDSSKLKVEVYKLTRRPERAFGMTEEIDGKPLPVAHVSTASNAINFEPDSQTLGRGIYWVRVRGDAVREGYVVELY